jgi:hypothetical protein
VATGGPPVYATWKIFAHGEPDWVHSSSTRMTPGTGGRAGMWNSLPSPVKPASELGRHRVPSDA